jgi:hypothetical protein
MIEGGCFCGNIKYEFEPGDYRVADCHCTMCRRTSGAPYVTWVVVPEDKFSYTSSQPEGKPVILKSSKNAQREFCSACGTPLVFRDTERSGTVDITVGSLREPEAFPPEKDVCADTKLSWLRQSGHS